MAEAQVGGPALAQVQQPARIHEETATVEKLTQWVKDNPDNDPHEGTDMEEPKAPPAEEKAEEAKPEESTSETDSVETVEFDEESPVFEIEYKTDTGKETKKLSLKDLREGYLAKQDYHRNIQKVAAERAQVQEQARLAKLQAAQEYMEKIELHKQSVAKLAGVKSLPEIEAMSREDPAGAQQEFLKMISVNQTLQQLEAEQSQAREKFDKEQRAALAEAIEKSRATLKSDIEGWSDELYNTVISNVTKDYGFDGNDVAQVWDARLIKVFHDAYKYRQLQKAKPEVSKRVVAIPKVIKPGSAEKPNPAKESAERARDQLKKSGTGEDFVRWYMNKNKR